MKRKFCLVREPGTLKCGSTVYVVWVGSSLRESTYFSLVQEFCKDVGWYFKQWSDEVDSALELRARYSRTDGTQHVSPLRFISISIWVCYQTIIDDSWAKLEEQATMSHHERLFRFRRDTNNLLQLHHISRDTLRQPIKRKHLSHTYKAGLHHVGALCLGAAMLFILDAIVSFFATMLWPNF